MGCVCLPGRRGRRRKKEEEVVAVPAGLCMKPGSRVLLLGSRCGGRDCEYMREDSSGVYKEEVERPTKKRCEGSSGGAGAPSDRPLKGICVSSN